MTEMGRDELGPVDGELAPGDSELLTRADLRQVLASLVSGAPESGAAVVRASRTIDPDLRAAMADVLVSGRPVDLLAEDLGDLLRCRLHLSNQLANECYRAAFYLGGGWEELAGNPLYARFTANKAGQALDKWVHYFDAYEQTLSGYVGRPVRVLEIGVFHGGGLDQLRYFLGPDAYLVGVDIDPASRAICADRFPVEVGDQTDPEFLAMVVEKHGPFDVIIDDGGHSMVQQITSIEHLFPGLRPGGTYLVEDCHTSYWPQYIDGEPTFIEWAKARIDDLNAYHHSQELVLPAWARKVSSMQFFDSIVVVKKGRRHPPFCEIAGTGSFVSGDRFDESLVLWKQAAVDVQGRATPLHGGGPSQHARGILGRSCGDGFGASREGLTSGRERLTSTGAGRGHGFSFISCHRQAASMVETVAGNPRLNRPTPGLCHALGLEGLDDCHGDQQCSNEGSKNEDPGGGRRAPTRGLEP